MTVNFAREGGQRGNTVVNVKAKVLAPGMQCSGATLLVAPREAEFRGGSTAEDKWHCLVSRS